MSVEQTPRRMEIEVTSNDEVMKILEIELVLGRRCASMHPRFRD